MADGDIGALWDLCGGIGVLSAGTAHIVPGSAEDMGLDGRGDIVAGWDWGFANT